MGKLNKQKRKNKEEGKKGRGGSKGKTNKNGKKDKQKEGKKQQKFHIRFFTYNNNLFIICKFQNFLVFPYCHAQAKSKLKV